MSLYYANVNKTFSDEGNLSSEVGFVGVESRGADRANIGRSA
jgi:hypothetical protein